MTAESERGQGCCMCCHSNTRRRGRRRGSGREGNYGAITESTEMRRCGSEERDEDLDESVFTGQFHSVYMYCVWCCICESISEIINQLAVYTDKLLIVCFRFSSTQKRSPL